MKLVPAKEYLRHYGFDYESVRCRYPDGLIPAEEFTRAGVPPVVRCTRCGMSMVVLGAHIDVETGETYCVCCVEC